MSYGACSQCVRTYPINSDSRFQLACPRCGRALHRLTPRQERRLSASMKDAALAARRSPPKKAALLAPEPAGPPARRARIAALAGFALIGLWLFLRASLQPRQPQRPQPLHPWRLLRAGLHQQSPCGRALWEARWYRTRAMQAVNQERAALLESLPPEESARIDRECWRRRLMAIDHNGNLQCARQAGLRAAALARSPAEKCQAALWLELIEYDADQPQVEREQARRMTALDPTNLLSRAALQRAAAARRLPSRGVARRRLP